MKESLILIPILSLFAIGVVIALQSGIGGVGSRDGRRTFVDNLSGLLVRVIGYLAGLIAVQRFVGFPIQLPW